MFDLSEAVKDAKTIGITGHIRPDGDCVGSTMAMYLYLKKTFPQKKVDIFLEPIPESYGYIDSLCDVRTDFVSEISEYDVFFVIDCDDKRIGGAKPYFDHAKVKINVDHHITNEGCGDINYIVPTASSASELVYDLISDKGLDEKTALALYLGIIHDCGVFQYSNTSPKTLNVAAQLISFGFDFSKIIEESFYQKTYKQNKLMAKAVEGSSLFLNGEVIIGCLDKETMEKFEALPSDTDGIVNQLRNTKGVHCAVFMYELDRMQYKVSMRSDEMVDVSRIAEAFGGGGHKKAAGVTIDGSYEEVKEKLLEKIKEGLQRGI